MTPMTGEEQQRVREAQGLQRSIEEAQKNLNRLLTEAANKGLWIEARVNEHETLPNRYYVVDCMVFMRPVDRRQDQHRVEHTHLGQRNATTQ